jgi:hypothetical protein
MIATTIATTIELAGDERRGGEVKIVLKLGL